MYLTPELSFPEFLPVQPQVCAPSSHRKKILLLSVSAGAGHIRAAEAIRAHATLYGAGVEAVHLDVMDYVPTVFRKIYTDFYIALVNRHPALWGYLYRVTDRARTDSLLQKLRRAIESLNVHSLLRKIALFEPDAIVCTHFLPAEILAGMRRSARLSCPVWVQVTDFDLHRMWVHKGISGYFAANEEVAFRMRAQGIASDTIHITGIPIMPAFGQVPERDECAKELGIDPHCTTVLLMGGGAGLGRLDAVASRLLGLEADFQLIVVAGKNTEMLAALTRLAARHPGRMVPQGFTDRVERLMACADLVVTKPGGLTVSECLAMGLPMILNSPIPGQEERNADFLLEQGVALKASDAVTLEYRVGHLLQNPDKLLDMRRKARMLARPGAAGKVLDTVLAHRIR
jgi:processive 1,2-diacylglycerol beta-glucosyltransferase